MCVLHSGAVLINTRCCFSCLRQAQQQQLDRAEAALHRSNARLREMQQQQVQQHGSSGAGALTEAGADIDGSKLLEMLRDDVARLRQQVGGLIGRGGCVAGRGPNSLDSRTIAQSNSVVLPGCSCTMMYHAVLCCDVPCCHQVSSHWPKELEAKQSRLAAVQATLNNGINTEVGGRETESGWANLAAVLLLF